MNMTHVDFKALVHVLSSSLLRGNSEVNSRPQQAIVIDFLIQIIVCTFRKNPLRFLLYHYFSCGFSCNKDVNALSNKILFLHEGLEICNVFVVVHIKR